MRSEIKPLICSPTGQDLELEIYEQQGDQIIEGVLRQRDGVWFPIINGVPCFLTGGLRPDHHAFAARHGLQPPPASTVSKSDDEQSKTNTTFSDKWSRFKRYGLEPAHQDFLFEWYRKKLGLASRDELADFYAGKRAILECGPGSGFNSRFMAEHTQGQVFALDVSEAANTTYENTRDLPNCHVVQADLMAAPFVDESFDFIIADGVLHHTPGTRLSVNALYRKLAPGGQFYFYVYRKMGPARQFCDQYIRSHFTQLSPEACYEACEGLTELGRELSHLSASVTLAKPIPVLGIPAGTHDVQRLLYYSFVKCFWNDAFDYETNNMVNFDWYHPHNAWQHSEEEVAGWLTALRVDEYQFNDSNPNGISVLLRKPA